jgi:hypothetical protein
MLKTSYKNNLKKTFCNKLLVKEIQLNIHMLLKVSSNLKYRSKAIELIKNMSTFLNIKSIQFLFREREIWLIIQLCCQEKRLNIQTIFLNNIESKNE